MIELAPKTGRAPAVTWMQRAHMVNCVFLDKSRAAILDNNAPDKLLWVTREQFLRQWMAPGRNGQPASGWTVVLLAPPPPPPPRTQVITEGGESIDDFTKPIIPRAPARRKHWPTQEVMRRSGAEDIKKPEHVPCYGAYGTWWGPPRYSISGRLESEQKIREVLKDDSKKLHLTLIGAKAERQKVINGLPPGAAEGQYHLQGYEPTAWEVQCGFAHEVACTAYLQLSDGTVLLRMVNPLPGKLALALRRADPKYDPRRDPDGEPKVPAPASTKSPRTAIPTATSTASARTSSRAKSSTSPTRTASARPSPAGTSTQTTADAAGNLGLRPREPFRGSLVWRWAPHRVLA